MTLKNYSVFTNNSRPYNLNIIGWRCIGQEDQFKDFIAIYWKDVLGWRGYTWPASTMPGVPWLLSPVNPDGAAILVPGQYTGYQLGSYKGYVALLQNHPVKVYRDNNRDGKIDMSSATIQEGYFGIHIHRAGLFSKIVGLSSAGCQVFQKWSDYSEFLWLCRLGAKNWGNRFTYTLLEC